MRCASARSMSQRGCDMACGCQGSKAAQPTSWLFKNDKGETKTFRSEIEARAAQVRAERAGGGGTITAKY